MYCTARVKGKWSFTSLWCSLMNMQFQNCIAVFNAQTMIKKRTIFMCCNVWCDIFLYYQKHCNRITPKIKQNKKEKKNYQFRWPTVAQITSTFVKILMLISVYPWVANSCCILKRRGWSGSLLKLCFLLGTFACCYNNYENIAYNSRDLMSN